jgi:hypothetical protein
MQHLGTQSENYISPTDKKILLAILSRSTQYDFVILNANIEPLQRFRRWAGDNVASAIILAAVAGALKNVRAGVEGNDATEMRTHRRQRYKLAVVAQNDRRLAAQHADPISLRRDGSSRNHLAGGVSKFTARGAKITVGEKIGKRRREKRHCGAAKQRAHEFLKKIASIHKFVMALSMTGCGMKVQITARTLRDLSKSLHQTTAVFTPKRLDGE